MMIRQDANRALSAKVVPWADLILVFAQVGAGLLLRSHGHLIAPAEMRRGCDARCGPLAISSRRLNPRATLQVGNKDPSWWSPFV